MEDYAVVDVEEAVVVAGQHTSMKTFVLYSSQANNPLPPTILRPLTACGNLQILDISVGRPLALTDGDVRLLVSHLPSLREFKIDNWHGSKRGAPPLLHFGLSSS